MENYVVIHGQKLALTEDQVQRLAAEYNIQQKQLSDFPVGTTVQIGQFELVILEQNEGETALILKGMYGNDTAFSSRNNNYDGSYVDKQCQTFAKELAAAVGEDNIVLHKVDLTSDDGLKDYGVIERRASVLTTERYRQYVDILDTVNPGCWWWLSTAWSTKRHGNSECAKCVSPSGFLYDLNYNGDYGVRPFCILKSTIFVSA